LLAYIYAYKLVNRSMFFISKFEELKRKIKHKRINAIHMKREIYIGYLSLCFLVSQLNYHATSFIKLNLLCLGLDVSMFGTQSDCMCLIYYLSILYVLFVNICCFKLLSFETLTNLMKSRLYIICKKFCIMNSNKC